MSWVEGLLGAVMGGAQEYGTILKEEETAKRKEEEEKRREERALTLAERKADAEQKRRLALEAEERKRVAGMMGPETRMTPAASPMEPEGIVESQIPAEERLQAGIQKALSQGDTKTAKSFLEQYQAIKDNQLKEAEAARKAEPKREELPAEFRSRMASIAATYPGQRDESGKPVNASDYDAYVRGELEKYRKKETYIKPERPEGVEKPLTRADTLKLEGALRGSLKDRSRVQEKAGEAPVFKEGVYSDLVTIANKIKKADPDLIRAPDVVADEAYRQYQGFAESARNSAKAEWTRLTTPIKDDREAEKKRKKDLENLKTSERIASEKTYIEKKSPQILRGLIGVGQKEQEPASRTVTVDGKEYTVRMAPDGKEYRYDEETGKYFLYQGK